jgi:hypothetical protein
VSAISEVDMAKHRSFRLTITPQDRLIAGGHPEALAVAAGQQAIVLLLAGLFRMALGNDALLGFCLIAAIASWICTLIVLRRRPKQPTAVDLAIIEYGFWPALLLVTVMGLAVGAFVR